MRNLVLVFFIAVLTSGCAVGNTHRYDLGDAELTLETQKSVAVMTIDLRPYILDGDKDPTFVGLYRAGFGNPFDVSTDSDRPLATDMSISIVEAMKKKGVKAFSLDAPDGATRALARQLLIKENADRLVILQQREWKTDTYFNTALIYSVTLEVLRGDGASLAENDLAGRDNLGGATVPADARVNTERAFKAKLELLLNDPEVLAALE